MAFFGSLPETSPQLAYFRPPPSGPAYHLIPGLHRALVAPLDKVIVQMKTCFPH
jgi:hypothetical protein